MLHLKLILSTILVAGCLLQVGGFPTDSSQEEGSSYFEVAGKFASRLLEIGAAAISKGTKDTVDTLSKALSSVNIESLTAALGLPTDLSQKVDLPAILTKLFMGQIEADEGVINYETAIIFLEKLAVLIPPLKKTVGRFKVALFIINVIKELRSWGLDVDGTLLVQYGMNMYYSDVDPAFKEKLIELWPDIFKAATGDKIAALKVIQGLADREVVLQILKEFGFGQPLEIIKSVIESVIKEVTSFTSFIKSADAAQTNK